MPFYVEKWIKAKMENESRKAHFHNIFILSLLLNIFSDSLCHNSFWYYKMIHFYYKVHCFVYSRRKIERKIHVYDHLLFLWISCFNLNHFHLPSIIIYIASEHKVHSSIQRSIESMRQRHNQYATSRGIKEKKVKYTIKKMWPKFNSYKYVRFQ